MLLVHVWMGRISEALLEEGMKKPRRSGAFHHTPRAVSAYRYSR